MEFICIKTIENTCYKEDSNFRFPFIKGYVYKVNYNFKGRTHLDLIDGTGMSYGIAQHWLWWKLDKWWKEYFVIIN